MNAHSVSGRKLSEGIEMAMTVKQIASAICEYNVHLRRVPIISTNGLHSGLMVQGMSKMLVYRAMLVLLIPISLYIISEIDVIAWYGSPEAK
jgi:hypothetical protein